VVRLREELFHKPGEVRREQNGASVDGEVGSCRGLSKRQAAEDRADVVLDARDGRLQGQI